MRVLLVSHGYPPFGIAGVERVAEQSATALAARGHEVTVLTRRPTAAPPALMLERTEQDGVSVIRAVGGDSSFGRYPGREDALEGIFGRVLVETLPDVVVLSHLLHHSAGYVRLAHAWRIPVVLELHDFYAACPLAHLQRVSGERCGGPEGGAACATHCFPGQDDAHARWALRALEFAEAVRTADVVVAPSRFVAGYFGPVRGAATPIVVVGNGFSLPAARVPRPARSGPLHLASIGVVIEHKGAHVVVDALRRARIGPVRYTLFGSVVGAYAQELRKAAADVPGLELRMYGSFSPAELPALLGDVDVAVVPSVVWETYSIAAREALACGIPVLASRLGALPEAIRDGINGALFTAGDAGELGKLIAGLHADRSRVDALAAGIEHSDWVTLEDRTDALERRLCAVVAGGTPAGARAPGSELRAIRGAL